jgi:isopenicillin N synthase-like dioxygenase
VDSETKKLIKQLEQKGFAVRRNVPTKKHSFEVPEDTLEQFFNVVHEKKLKIKDAIAEALETWIEKNKAKK